jgi:hypothetical protein
MILTPLPASTSSNAAVKLAVAIAYQEPEPGGAFAEVHEQIACLLRGPRPRGVRGDAQDVHAAGLDLHREQDVQAPEEHGVYMQEIARQDPGRLGGQELSPLRHEVARGE